MALDPTEEDRAFTDRFTGLAGMLFGGQPSAMPKASSPIMQLAQGPAYDSGLGAFAFGDAFTQARNNAVNQRALQAAAQAKAQQQQQLQAARAAYVANPNARTFAALTVLDPEHSEAIKRGFDALDADAQKSSLREISAIRGYLAAGRPEAAAKRLEARIEADKAAGQDTADDEAMLDLIRTSPKDAAAAVDYQLASVMGPDKWSAAFKEIGEGRRADEKLPSDIALAEAQAEQAGATAMKTTAEAAEVAPNAEAERTLRAAQAQELVDRTALAADRLALDRDRLNADVQHRMQLLDVQQGQLSPDATKSVNEAVIASQASRALATRAGDLADRIQAEPRFAGGWGSGLVGALTTMTGDASTATALRREYTQLRNEQAIKNLPPGVATDKDIQLALKGMPNENASRETMVSFLRGMQKLQNIVAESKDREADWMAGNGGSLGPARRGFFVGNTFVAPGAKFDDIQKAARREQAKAAAAARVGAQ